MRPYLISRSATAVAVAFTAFALITGAQAQVVAGRSGQSEVIAAHDRGDPVSMDDGKYGSNFDDGKVGR